MSKRHFIAGVIVTLGVQRLLRTKTAYKVADKAADATADYLKRKISDAMTSTLETWLYGKKETTTKNETYTRYDEPKSTPPEARIHDGSEEHHTLFPKVGKVVYMRGDEEFDVVYHQGTWFAFIDGRFEKIDQDAFELKYGAITS